MTELLRATLDTNVLVSATLSRNPNSPTRELMICWRRNEFTLLTCDELFQEFAEKLIERHVAEAEIEEQLDALALWATWVVVPSESIEPLLNDSDDNVVVACAVIGHADYLVTYDPHFDVLGGDYRGVKIVKALPFLWALRGEPPTNS